MRCANLKLACRPSDACRKALQRSISADDPSSSEVKRVTFFSVSLTVAAPKKQSKLSFIAAVATAPKFETASLSSVVQVRAWPWCRIKLDLAAADEHHILER